MFSSCAWSPAPTNLSLQPGWVDVFLLELDLPEQRLEALAGLLSPDEHARAQRFIPAGVRRRFIAAHGQVRSILASYLDLPPAALRFKTRPGGKPYLPDGRLDFNLSHSQGAGLLGVTCGQEIGVDIESTLRQVEYANIARRYFAPSEYKQLEALPGALQPMAFFNCWTRKEAYIKALGKGLSIPLDSFAVSLLPGDPACLNAPDPGWQLHILEPGPEYAAALVVKGEVEGLRCWSAA